MSNKKTVIITGASRGIGNETAKAFANEGYNVLINYNNSCEEALKLKDFIVSNGGCAEIFNADVSNSGEVNHMIEFCLETFKNINVLVNNAAISQTKLFTDITQSDWDRMMDVNLKGVFNCTSSVVKHMISQKYGKIINVSSIWGMTGASCEVHYSAAKAGIIGFTKALAKELGPCNIQVNCVAPGIIRTSMISEYNRDEINELINQTPLLRLGTMKDVAYTTLFLASEKADFITGQLISPNGGFVI